MKNRAPIYLKHGTNPAQLLLTELMDSATKLREQCPPELYDDLLIKINQLDEACRASLNIFRNTRVIGSGVDKAKKAIACDNVIAIIKQIKNIKAW